MLYINKVLFKHEKKMLFNYSRLALIVTTAIIITSTLLHLVIGQFPQSLQATPSSYAQLLSLMVWLFFPYFSLALFNAERQNGSLNRLLALPLSEATLIMNRLYAMIFVAIPLALTAIFWYTLSYRWYYLDSGLFFSALIQLFLVVALASSSSIYFSMLGNKSNLSVLYSALFAIFLLVTDLLTHNPTLSSLGNFVSLNKRLYLLRMGIINTADIIFFIALSTLFIGGSINQLRRRRGFKTKKPYTPFMIIIITLLMQNNSYQYDLTATGMHQQSPYSKELLQSLTSPLYITYYISPNLEYDQAINQNYRAILHYQGSSKNVYVSKKILSSANSATALGLSLQNSKSNDSQYAGVVIEYQENAIAIPLLIDHDEVEYHISSKIAQLLNGKPHISLITDDNRTEDDLSFLQLALAQQFDVSNHFTEADAYIIMGQNGLSRTHTQQLFKLSEQGKGVLIGLSPKKIPILTNEAPSSIDIGPLQHELYSKGLTLGQELVFQQDSLMLFSKAAGELARQSPYAAWPYGYRATSSKMASLVAPLKPLYSSYLDLSDQWHPLINSNRHAYIPFGPLDLRPSIVARSNPDKLNSKMAPFTFMAQYRDYPLFVMASDSFLSDLVETAAPSNIGYSELLVQTLAGRGGLTNIKMRYWPMVSLKKNFSLTEDALLLRLIFLLFMGLILLINAIFFKKLSGHHHSRHKKERIKNV